MRNAILPGCQNTVFWLKYSFYHGRLFLDPTYKSNSYHKTSCNTGMIGNMLVGFAAHKIPQKAPKQNTTEMLSVHQLPVIKNLPSIYQHTSAPLLLFPSQEVEPQEDQKQQTFSQITLNAAFNTFMDQVVFLNDLSSLFEGAILLCRKKDLFSKALQYQTLPFALRSHGEESLSNESFPCFSKDILKANPHVERLPFWDQLLHIFSGVTGVLGNV